MNSPASQVHPAPFSGRDCQGIESTPQVVAEAISRTPDVVLSRALLAFMPSVSSGWAWVWVLAQGREWRRGKEDAASADHPKAVTHYAVLSGVPGTACSPLLSTFRRYRANCPLSVGKGLPENEPCYGWTPFPSLR